MVCSSKWTRRLRENEQLCGYDKVLCVFCVFEMFVEICMLSYKILSDLELGIVSH